MYTYGNKTQTFYANDWYFVKRCIVMQSMVLESEILSQTGPFYQKKPYYDEGEELQ